MASSFFGLELLFKTVCGTFRNHCDVLVCFLHWKLTANGFKCVGQREEVTFVCPATEALPSEWNSLQGMYILQYRLGNSTYLFKGVQAGEDLLINVLRSNDNHIWNTSLRISNYVNDITNFGSAYVQIQQLDSFLQKELVDLMVKEENGGTGVEGPKKRDQRRQREHDDNSDDDEPLRFRPDRPSAAPDWVTDPDNHFSIGRGDLDPMGSGRGGGMIMNPPGRHRGHPVPGNLPRGAVPPGSRFDPFGPPNPDDFGPIGGPRPHHPSRRGGFGPNPDHLLPPGFDDDMFM